MSYEPYDPLMAPLEDRIAWALCQIIDDDAPMHWTRYRFVAGCIVSNPTLMADLQMLCDRKFAAQRTSVRPEELRALVKDLATGKIIPPDDRNREATQKSTVLAVLVDLTLMGVSPAQIEALTNNLCKEMTEGPTAWAFKP